MRLLFISNFYPPVSWGGYERWCQEIAESLRSDGHEVVVLTSRYLKDSLPEPEPDWIRRDLHLEMEFESLSNGIKFFTHRKAAEADNRAIVANLIQQQKPQAVLVWGMWNLPQSILQVTEQALPGRVVYYFGDYWPTLPSQHWHYWSAPARNRYTYWPKKVLGMAARKILAREVRYTPKFDHALFPSRFMQAEYAARGIQPASSEVILGAVDFCRYRGRPKPAFQSQPLSLLYVGRLTPEKGIETALEALSVVVQEHHLSQVKLTVVGAGEAQYEAQLKKMVQDKGIQPYVEFLGQLPGAELPAIFHRSDIFLFTSIWQEPFGRVLVEAMASECLVLGTATGGAAEILLDGATGIVYPPGDAQVLAYKISQVSQDPARYRSLIQGGRDFAVANFSIERMAKQIECSLARIAAVEVNA